MKIKSILVIIGIAVFFVTSVNGQVIADFTADITLGCSPVSVSFTNNSTGATSYSWDFGNGNTSVAKDAQAIYSSSGSYTVKLTINGNAAYTKSVVIKAFKKPSAAFSANNKLCTGQTVQFNDLSTLGDAPLKTWFWDFQDGTTKSEQNPTLPYYVAGKNSVFLTVTDNNGCVSSLLKEQYIDVVNKPAISFQATPSSACKIPTTVKFSNTSTGGGILTYEWDFLGGNTSTLKEPSFTYTSFGSYNVKLKVTSDYGCSDNLSVQAVTIGAVKASGSLAQGGKTILNNGIVCAGDINFQSTSTGGSAINWDFGDGSTPDNAYLPSGVHNYSTAGTFIIKLIASPGTACADTVKWNIVVEKAIAGFTMAPDKSCQSPATVQFTNTSLNATSYLWTFPDNTTFTTLNTSHIFTVPADKDDFVIHEPHSFDISLQTKTANGCASEIIKTFVISRPTAMFSADTIFGCLPVKVNFTDKSVSDAPIAFYKWEFGDNNSQTTSSGSMSYSYNKAGIFKARLIITDSDVNNCKDTSNYITIKVGNVPHPNFKAETATSCSSNPVRLTDLTTAADNVDFWQYSSMGTSISSCSNVANPDWKFRNEVGNLSVKLKVGSNGCFHDTTINNVINNLGPIGNFTFDLNCSTPLNYTFTGVAKGATSYEWKFGDGVSDNVLSPIHTYASGGNYLVKFITHNATCHDTISQMVYARLPNPQFTMNVKGCVGDEITFTGKPSHIITPVLCRESYLWNFNDKSADLYTDKDDIKHTFNNRGTYNVSLTTIYDNGCTQTISKPIRIYQPFAGFKADKIFGCTPLPIIITDTSKIDGNAFSKLELDYGDGTLPVTITSGAASNHEYNSNTSVSYIATLTVTDIMSCVSTANLPIGIGNPTNNFLVDNPNVCAGSTVQFTSYEPQPDSVIWDFGDGEKSNQITGSQIHKYNLEGKFKLKMNVYTYGCRKDSTTVVDYIKVQKASAQFTVSDSVWNCYPKPIQLMPNFVSKETVSGIWDFGSGNNVGAIDTSKHPQIYTYTYTTPGVYSPKLSIQTSFGCKATFSKVIKITGPTGTFTASPENACKGTEITLTLKDTANLIKYEWDLGDGRVVMGNPVKFKYTTSGDKLIGLILYGRMENCKPVDTVRYHMGLKAQFSINNPAICEKSNLVFVNESIGQNNQTWDFGDGTPNSAEVNPKHIFSSGKFTIKLIANGASCVDTSQKIIIVNPLPVLTISNDTIICLGATASIHAYGGDQIVWHPGIGLTDSTINRLVILPKTTEYYKASVKINLTQCINTDSVLVFVQQPPVIKLNFAKDTTIHIGEQIALNITTQVPVSYLWSPNYALSCINCPDPIAKPFLDTTYRIDVKDVNGCFKDSAFLKIRINNNIPLELPSAFTPSGDETNRILSPKGFGIEELLEFKIYNRWGNLVFSSNDISKGWDGKYQGKDQPIDTYIYTVTARMATPDGAGIIKKIKGTVLLIR